VNTTDAVASIGIVLDGNFPLINVGSPIFVFISDDQNINDKESFAFKLAKTVFDIVYI
jgi:hypothetical protein